MRRGRASAVSAIESGSTTARSASRRREAFKSIPIDQAPRPPLKPKPGKNHTGLVTYGDSYVLWRHATHYNHDPHGGPEVTGKYDAMEGFKLTDEMAAKYVAANKL